MYQMLYTSTLKTGTIIEGRKGMCVWGGEYWGGGVMTATGLYSVQREFRDHA